MHGVRRVVIKVGTSTLTHASGEMNHGRMQHLVEDINGIVQRGVESVLVSSGAVGAGVGRLKLKDKPKTIPEKQAAAAVGQGILIHAYERLFEKFNLVVAQVLLTRADIASRIRYLNARNTLTTLLKYGVVPVVNENDTVAVEEIQVGDNDRLSALVACLVDSDLLVILTDTEGVYTRDPRMFSDAQLISVYSDSGNEPEFCAGGAGSRFGTGGMNTKLEAARIVTNSGIPMVVANGSRDGVLQSILSGDEIGTLFMPSQHRLHTKKRWIGFGSSPAGKIHVDEGAARAIVTAGKSLLPSGVTRTEGSFAVGHVVSVIEPEMREIARGIVNYTAGEVELIKGKHSDEIEEVLGYRACPEVIHRDNLTVTV